MDEVILVPVSPRARQYNRLIVLNPTAAFFYTCIQNGTPVEQIPALAAEEFEDAGDCSGDLREFLREMSELEAIRALPS